MSDDRTPTEEDGDIWEAVKRPEPSSPYAFRIYKGAELLRTIRLEPDVTYVGRMSENHVVLDDPKVSRSHARVLNRDGGYFIQDQESENGIYVEGQKVKEYLLSPGVKVAIGGHVLEVVRAGERDRPALREHQLETAEEEEWRLDQTINGSQAQLQKLLEEHAEKRPSGKAPTLSFELTIGPQVFKSSGDLTQARARKEGDFPEDAVEIRVSVGKRVFYKKIPL